MNSLSHITVEGHPVSLEWLSAYYGRSIPQIRLMAAKGSTFPHFTFNLRRHRRSR